MVYATSHNGGRTQMGLNATKGQWAFLNYLKASTQEFQYYSNPNQNFWVDFATRDSDGYPTSIQTGGYKTFCHVPSSSDRSNNYILKWDGAGTVLNPVSGTGIVSGNGGSSTAFSPAVDANFPRQVFVVVSATAASPNHVRNIRVVHADDEAALDAGEVFGTQFKQRIADSGVGVLRFMDWQVTNLSRVTKFGDLKATTYWSWFISEWRTSFQSPSGMSTGGTGTAFTLVYPGFVLADKAIIQLYFDRNQAGACTLNVNSTGDVNIIAHNSVPLSSGGNSLVVGGANKSWATLVYDADLHAWIKYGGDVAFGDNPGGFQNGVPLDPMLQLCAETGCHPYFCIPFLADDLNTLATDLAAYCKAWCIANNVTWMIPRFEGQNEIFNGFAGFHANAYASAKQGVLNGAPWPSGVQVNTTFNVSAVSVNGGDANKTDITFSTGGNSFAAGSFIVGNNFGGMGAAWGSGGSAFTAYVTAGNVGGNPDKITVDKVYAGTYTSGGTINANLVDFEDWYGTHMSKIGQAVSSAYSADRTKYEVLCGVQTGNGSTAGGCNSSNTRLASYSFVLRGGSAAYNWSTGICTAPYFNSADYGQAGETTAMNTWGATTGSATISGTALTFSGSLSAGDEISGYGVAVGTKVVSGSNPNYVVDISQTYSGTIYAANAVSRRVLEKTYVDKAMNSSGTTVTVIGLRTLMSNWATWANGFGVKKMHGYEGGFSPDFPSASGSTLTAQFREATKLCSSLVGIQRTVYKDFCGIGAISYPEGFRGVFPSCYFFVGNKPSDYAWAILNDAYQSETPQFTGIRLFNEHKRRFTIRT